MAGVQIDGVNNKIDFDDDLDTSISANTDDTLVFEIAGATDFTMTANTFTAASGSTITSPSIKTPLIEFTDGDDAITIADGGGVTFPIASTFTLGFTSNAASTITTADNTAQLTLKSTDADASVGPDFVLQRDSGSPADDDSLGRIRFVADNDAGEALDHISINASIRDASDGTEDAQLTFYMLTAGAVVDAFHISPTETVFNDASVDRNFRIESNGNATMLVVDGENNKVGIGTNAPADALHIKAGNGIIRLHEATQADTKYGEIESSNGRLFFHSDRGNAESSSDMRFHVDNSEKMRINDSEVAIGTTSFSGKITTLQNASGRTSAFFEHNGDNSSAYPAGVVSKFTTDVNSSARSLYEGYGSGTRRFAVYSSGTVANSTGSYGSLSDQRIKTNITDASSQWADIKAIKVRNFKKIDNPDLVQIGVVAQELESVSSKLIEETQPDATIITHDATFGTLYTADDAETQDAIEQVLYTADDQEVIDGAKNVGDIKIEAEPSTKQIGDVKEIKEQVKSVKYSVLYMKAIKALQEAMTRIETLETKVAALEG